MKISYKRVIGIAGVATAVYLVMKYLLSYIFPFLVAFLLVKIFHPAAVRMERKLHIKKDWIVLLFMGTLLGSAAILFWFLGSRLFAQIRSIAHNLDVYEAGLETMIGGCCDFAQATLGINGRMLYDIWESNMGAMSEKLHSINVTVLVQNSLRYATVFFKGVGVFFVVFVAVLLIIRDYDEIKEKLERFAFWEKTVHVGSRMWELAGKWLRAQGIILLTVMAECVIGLWIFGNPYALLTGILIGVLDALPFIGTGMILLPWAVIWIIRGDFLHAAAYATLFLITNSTREYLEPKLLGQHLGVYPIVIAITVYAGVCIFGMPGVLLGPLALLLVIEISKELYYTEDI